MAANFLKAIGDANISVTTSRNGPRVIGGNAAMDRQDNQADSGGYRGSYSRGRGRGGRSRGNRPYRGGGGGGRYNNRRGGRNDRGGRGRYSGVTPYSRFQQDDGDEDDSMRESSKPYGGRQPRSTTFDSKWFKINIPGGKSHDKNWLLNKMRSLIDEPYELVEFHYVGDSASFFVDDKNIADKLKQKSHRITCRDGSKIAIHVRNSDPPRFSNRQDASAGGSHAVHSKPLDEETEKIIMNCLAQRFIVETNSVNLSNLMEDTTLSSNNIQGNLNKPWLMQGIVDVISKVSPGLIGLDLSGNHLRNLDMLRSIPGKLQSLEVLSLKDNEARAYQIQNLEELEKIKIVKSLKHLLISGNPLCIKYQKNSESLLRDVRSKLDSVELLDGIKLPPPILFDVPAATPLPEVKEHYFSSPQMKQKIIQFVTQYFQLYDGEDRQGLLELYHDQATFSMSIMNVHMKDYNREKPQPMNDYYPFNRNLTRLKDKGKKLTMIKNTKLSAVAYLNELPRTRHDFESFALDVSTETPTFVCFTVRGNFMEGDARDTLRAFSRTFILLLTPDNNMKIMNDQLQVRNSIGKPQPSTSSSTQSPPVAVSSLPTAAPIGQNALSTERQALLTKFCEASKMNAKFSMQCLEQNNWDFQKAGQVFTDLQREGKIPPEAFVP
eukprot:gene19908-21853_t